MTVNKFSTSWTELIFSLIGIYNNTFTDVYKRQLLFCSWGCSSRVSDKPVTLETLLDEMVSVEEQALYPVPSYTCRQESSYDRASVSPDSAGWFANSDGFGIKRVDTVAGRIEKVMFDEVGPGAITRIWITTIDKRGTWRFYFDDRYKREPDTAQMCIRDSLCNLVTRSRT